MKINNAYVKNPEIKKFIMNRLYSFNYYKYK